MRCGFARKRDAACYEMRKRYLYAVNMGATAIGTGINVPKGYAEVAVHLAKITGKPIVAGLRHAGRDLGISRDSWSIPPR